MASILESLPLELLDVVLTYLRLMNLVHLMRCSRLLHRSLEPALYRSHDARNEAMRWACTNNSLHTIRLVTSYDASVSTVVGLRRQKEALDSSASSGQAMRMKWGQQNILTLYLAAKFDHVDAFALLLELGAGIDDVEPKQVRALMQRFCFSAVKEHLLRLFLEAGLVTKMRQQQRSGRKIQLPFVDIIRSVASPDLVKLLLDDGEDPNCQHRIGDAILATPLSGAILANSPAVFDLLLSRGADINGADVSFEYPMAKLLHIPLFTAARVMLKQGFAMLQMCLDSGANINRRSHYNNHSAGYFTVVNVFLDSVVSWTQETTACVLDGLTYLLQRHANLELPGERIFNEPSWILHQTRWTMSPLMFLLNKWGISKLSNLGFFITVRCLIENGDGKHLTLQILTRFSNGRDSGNPEPISAWEEFVELIIKHRAKDQADRRVSTIDDLLASFILQTKPTSETPFKDIDRITVLQLIRAGANINASLDHHGGKTLLHTLCSDRDLARFALAHTHVNEDGESYSCSHAQHMTSFFLFLRDEGADPTRVVDGKTSIDVLLNSGIGYFEGLAAVLEEKSGGDVLSFADGAEVPQIWRLALNLTE